MGATVLAVAGFTLMSAQAAVAQAPTTPPPGTPTTPPAGTPTTPPPGTPTTPPVGVPVTPPTLGADVSISLTGERGTFDADSPDDGFEFEVFVANFGPATAQNVRVVLSLPEEFDENQIAGDLTECSRSNASEEGTVICNLGDLPPADKRSLTLELELDGDRIKSGEHERTVTVAYILADSTDPESDNNLASREVEIQR